MVNEPESAAPAPAEARPQRSHPSYFMAVGMKAGADCAFKEATEACAEIAKKYDGRSGPMWPTIDAVAWECSATMQTLREQNAKRVVLHETAGAPAPADGPILDREQGCDCNGYQLAKGLHTIGCALWRIPAPADGLRQVHATIALLNSMVLCGEDHSDGSREMVRNALRTVDATIAETKPTIHQSNATDDPTEQRADPEAKGGVGGRASLIDRLREQAECWTFASAPIGKTRDLLLEAAAALASRPPADNATLRAECYRLREALRAEVIGGTNTIVTGCALCCGDWPYGQTERHAPGCIAAPTGERTP